MEITAGNLTALFTGFNIIFQRSFEKPPSYYEKIATVVRSTSRQTTYPWLRRTTKFREWLGDRVAQALETHTYTIVNKDFEDTISISRNDIEDDTYGVYEPAIDQLLGYQSSSGLAAVHDGQERGEQPGERTEFRWAAVFFGRPSGRPMGASGDIRDTVASNVNSSGSGPYWFLIDASRDPSIHFPIAAGVCRDADGHGQ